MTTIKQKIFILGITSYLCRKFLNSVAPIDCEIYTLAYNDNNYEKIKLNFKEVISLKDLDGIKNIKFDKVFNFTAYYWGDRQISQEINFSYPLSIISQLNFKKVINCSTVLAPSESAYAYYKNKLEDELIKKYKELILNLKITNFYGDNYSHDNFITSCINHLRLGKEFKINKPNYIIELIFIDDLVSILRDVFDNKLNILSETELLITTNRPMTLKQVAKEIKMILNSESIITESNNDYSQNRTNFNTNKMKKYNLKADTDLETGIKLILKR